MKRDEDGGAHIDLLGLQIDTDTLSLLLSIYRLSFIWGGNGLHQTGETPSGLLEDHQMALAGLNRHQAAMRIYCKNYE